MNIEQSCRPSGLPRNAFQQSRRNTRTIMKSVKRARKTCTNCLLLPQGHLSHNHAPHLKIGPLCNNTTIHNSFDITQQVTIKPTSHTYNYIKYLNIRSIIQVTHGRPDQYTSLHLGSAQFLVYIAKQYLGR